MPTATLEVYRQGRWQVAATLTPQDPARGYRGACRLEYAMDYAIAHIDEAEALAAGVSCRYPVDFDLHDEATWPAFLLDVLPSGAGRLHWLQQLGLADGASADWPLLLSGTACPPGNLRIREAVLAKNPGLLAPGPDGAVVPMSRHPGFTLDDICRRQEFFIEYAYQNGAQTAGASDVQGVAPKFLLVEDHHGRWHAEGALPDDQVAACWLIKFPRGRTVADRQILRNEAAYMTVADSLGLHTHAPLQWREDTLLIPRFDRVVVQAGAPMQRFGMESLCSLAGVAEYGVPVPHPVLCAALARYSTEPVADLLEYVCRDIVNVALGNKDNHARNTAVLRDEAGTVRLSPLYDFAPMYLDPEGIARVCRWDKACEQGGQPDWAAVLVSLQPYVPLAVSVPALQAFGTRLADLPAMMCRAGVDDDIIAQRQASIITQAQQLDALVETLVSRGYVL